MKNTKNSKANPAPAEDFLFGLLVDGTLMVERYLGNRETVVIPEEIDGKRVTTIGGCTFAGCTSLISITIPESVTTIGDRAFVNCKSLASITIPDGVKIGEDAFKGTPLEDKLK